MTMDAVSDLASLHNAHNHAVETTLTPRNPPIATGSKREGAWGSGLPLRFAAKISPEPNTGCWLWLGCVDRSGYGQVKYKGKTTEAHRAVYELLGGEVAAEDLDHTCRVRSCVNPLHLEPVSHRENMRRGSGFAGQNARKTHCVRGHEFTTANTRPHGDGNRACRQCETVRRSLPSGRATVPMPIELRSPQLRGGSGKRVTGGKQQSAYASPLGARVERRDEMVEVRAHLLAVRTAARDGATLLEAVGDGTLWGWRSREVLSHCLGEPLANWDRRQGRTQLERIALAERAWAEVGGSDAPHRGGWTVGGAR